MHKSCGSFFQSPSSMFGVLFRGGRPRFLGAQGLKGVHGEGWDALSLKDRQEALLLGKLPPQMGEPEIREAFGRAGVLVPLDHILLYKCRLGRHMGRALVLTQDTLGDLTPYFPAGVTAKIQDDLDVRLYVEQLERFQTLGRDLRKLCNPEFFQRILTFDDVPPTYGRRSLAQVIFEASGVQVDPSLIVFRFKKYGLQGDQVFVVAPSDQAMRKIMSAMQETPIPKRAAFGGLFGVSFLKAERSTLFASHPSLDFGLDWQKGYQVVTCGWEGDLDVQEIRAILGELRIYPSDILKFPLAADGTTAFLLTLDRMVVVKKVMVRLKRLKAKWQLRDTDFLYLYPKQVDIRYSDAPNRETYEDSDLNERVDY